MKYWSGKPETEATTTKSGTACKEVLCNPSRADLSPEPGRTGTCFCISHSKYCNKSFTKEIFFIIINLSNEQERVWVINLKYMEDYTGNFEL